MGHWGISVLVGALGWVAGLAVPVNFFLSSHRLTVPGAPLKSISPPSSLFNCRDLTGGSVASLQGADSPGHQAADQECQAAVSCSPTSVPSGAGGSPKGCWVESLWIVPRTLGL